MYAAGGSNVSSPYDGGGGGSSAYGGSSGATSPYAAADGDSARSELFRGARRGVGSDGRPSARSAAEIKAAYGRPA